MGFHVSSNESGGLHFAKPFSFCTVIPVCGSGCAGCLFTPPLPIPTEGLFLLFLLLQTVPSAVLQGGGLASSPGTVTVSSGPVTGIIGGKITPAYSFPPCFLCLSSLAFGKDNTTFVVTSLVSKQMPLWDQLLLYTSKTCVCISDIYSRSANNSSFPLPVPPLALIALWGASLQV